MLLTISEPGAIDTTEHETAAPAIGIDLGTTNSVVGVVEDGKVRLLQDPATVESMIPSAVAGDIVGEAALSEPGVVTSSKRLMGGEQTPFAMENASKILAHLKKVAEASLEQNIDKAVITVPAYFDDTARQATKDAAKLAGLEVLRLVNEPTAAALAYNLDEGKEGIYAVYDLGGGTFDVSILRLEKGVFQVLATGGDTNLGGDDFDAIIAENFLCQVGYDGGLDKAQQASLQQLARDVKEKLTTQESADLFTVLPNNNDAAHRFMRKDAEKLWHPLVQRTVQICQQVLQDAALEVADIQGVVMVGGSTRVPLVQHCVAEYFQQEPLNDLDPDTIVAQGAALQAHNLTQGGGALLLDVCPLSLGLETMGGLVEKIIPRNTPVPVAKAQDFTTYQDGQTGLDIHVVQGEREMVADNLSLAKFTLSGIPPMTAGAARVRVMFTVDADGLLTVSAEEETTGEKQEVAVKPTHGVSQEEMANMLYASLEHGEEDMRNRLLTQAKVDANRVLKALQAALAVDAHLLDAEEQQRIEQAAFTMVQHCERDDREAIIAAREAVEKAAEPFVEQRMNQAVQRALTGKDVAAV